MGDEITSLDAILEKNIPEHELSEVRRILYGNPVEKLDIPEEAAELSSLHNFQIAAYKIPCAAEQTRAPRLVKIGAIQNQIVLPTDKPVLDQVRALHDRIKVNLCCLK